MLPMPMGIEEVYGDAPISPQLRRNMEEIVIKWTGHISEVLSEDSSLAFENEEHPLPRSGSYFHRYITDFYFKRRIS